jgi:hypothetical protein
LGGAGGYVVGLGGTTVGPGT